MLVLLVVVIYKQEKRARVIDFSDTGTDAADPDWLTATWERRC